MGDKEQQSANPQQSEAGHEDESHLGLAGRMAQAFIHSPLTPLFFFAMLAMGVMGLIMTPRQEDPQISVPMIDIFVQFPGATSEEVSSLAIEPLERIMSEIPGVKHVYSAAEREQGMVTVRFIVGEDLGQSIVKVHDKIQSNLDKMPPGVQPPLVKPVSIDDVPVVTLTLWSENLDQGQMRTLSNDVLQRLKEIPNTGASFVTGGLREQIRVQVMPERLSGYNVSLDEVAHTIRTANSEQKAGSTESGDQHFTVYTGSFLRNVDDVSNLMIASRNGSPVYVRDVARVTEEPEEPKSLVTYYTGKEYPGDTVAIGMPAVTIAIAKKIGSNGVTVAEDILAKVETLKSPEIGLITPDVHVEVTRNYGKTASDKVNSLILKLFIATGAVTILVWIFLGWRPAFVVTLVIPVTILMTVFSAWIMGYTIDRVSLFALIFSIGILVDDAIVVIENIYRRWLIKGKTDTATAVDAVREVGNPTILATFTVIAALLPMGFVSGLMGPYMEPIPALGSVAMMFSLFAAFVFVPWMAMRIKPGMRALEKAEEREHRDNEYIAGVFNKLLVPLIASPRKGRLFLLSLVVLFFLSCSLFVLTWVPVKMLPFDNKPEFSVAINMPSGTAMPTTANLTSAIAERLRDELPHITAMQTYVGTARPFDFNGMVRHYYLRNRPWQAEIQVQLVDKGERSESSHELAVMAREVVQEIVAGFNTGITTGKGARATIVEMPPGPPVLQTVVAEIYGPDDRTRRETARMMTHLFEQTEGMADVDNYMQDDYEIWRFEVNTEKAVRRGISVDAINRNLTMALGANRLGDVKRGSVLEPTYIVLEIPLSERSDPSRLGDLPIPMPGGQGTIPLTELGGFVRDLEDDIVFHKDLRPVEYVVGDAVGRLGAPIYPMLKVQEALQEEQYKTPDGVNMEGTFTGAPADVGKSAFEWGGEWTVTYETFRDMGIAFAVALILIYILVVWEFGNFIVPAVIMTPIPLTLLGIVPGHIIIGAIMGGGDFTATSMIGFIALAGIIVRNSILLVDFTIHEVRNGVAPEEAVVLACRARTRPIMITAFALVAGSFVILTDPIFQGMAISLLFGVVVSSVLTLMVIPIGCVYAGHHLCPDCDLLPKKDEGGPQGEGGQGASWPQTALARATGASMIAYHFGKVAAKRTWDSTAHVFGQVAESARQSLREAEQQISSEKEHTRADIKDQTDVSRPVASAQEAAKVVEQPAEKRQPEIDKAPADSAQPATEAEASPPVQEPARAPARKKPTVKARTGAASKPKSSAAGAKKKVAVKKAVVKKKTPDQQAATQARPADKPQAKPQTKSAPALTDSGNGKKPSKAKVKTPAAPANKTVSSPRNRSGRRGIRLNPNI